MTARRALASLGFAITAVTCSRSLAQAPSVQPEQAPRSASASVVPSPATTPPVAPPSYDPKGRRDPFQPIETVQQPRSAVASARLRGILHGSAIRALVETPDGIGYIMRLGDTLADGRLIEIGTDSVVFRVPSRSGSATDSVVLRLPSD